ncbi:hypothetical protein B0J18DRAFT_3073 [Chaetomium sp. MPI-SDFR-AT-0129]|nr:hypothetical protein B0J18DRAFT_3073 [Chaetomium sp. MPI-SDFR-AT-0129]
MKFATQLIVALGLLLAPVLAAPIAVEGANTEIQQRDGSSEFDTDLCVLKKREAAKRGDVLGIGIDNCDM